MQLPNPSEGIRSLSLKDRPRERLLESGAASLSDSELLAILLGSGTQGESALSLARRVLGSSEAPFKRLAGLTPEGLQGFRGVGPAKTVRVLAALEIGRRMGREQVADPGSIRQSRDAYLLLKPKIAALDHEEFWVIFLNTANRVVCVYQVSKGGITGTLVDVRIILMRALEFRAVALVLAHNHPSGNLVPSKADKQITRKVIRAARLMDIRVLDHIILNGEEYYSFADEQLL